MGNSLTTSLIAQREEVQNHLKNAVKVSECALFSCSRVASSDGLALSNLVVVAEAEQPCPAPCSVASPPSSWQKGAGAGASCAVLLKSI